MAIESVVVVGTYPPTRCGLATFTASLHGAISSAAPHLRTGVIRLTDDEVVDGPAPAEVAATWTPARGSLQRALDAARSFDTLVLQHEYGIYPGPDGNSVLDFLDASTNSIVAVLHTVLEAPTARQEQILEAVADRSSSVVVQSEAARRRLVDRYRVDPAKLDVIPHGAAENFGRGPARFPHPRSVLTWGLIGPGKGIEHALAAFAPIARANPDVRYVVCGRTHPKVLAAQGERYRMSLMELAHDLGISEQVEFDDRYHDWDSLRAVVREATIVLLPYDSREQITSGVLVEAIASGKPVVATAFPHAVELLATGVGIVVPHGDTSAMTDALALILDDPLIEGNMSRLARAAAAQLLWPEVGRRYVTLLERLHAHALAG